MIRDAETTDAAAIADIYNDAVQHTTAIWNEVTVDAADRAGWMHARRAAGFPVLVATDDAGTVIGYASYGPWRAFDGYRHTVEHSVYVRDGQRGAGLGSTLLTALVDRARAAEVHVMVAAVEAGNAASIRLHERHGFERVGLMPEVGTKFGRWLDLALLQLTLGQPEQPEQPAD